MTRRRTRRSLERAVEDLEGTEDYPDTNLAEIIAAMQADAFETVDGEAGLVRVHGQVKRSPEIDPSVWSDCPGVGEDEA
ncbi:hypothetical protein [Halopelagius fulvigenes]|uniref:Halobacterial output domain-containing protein n=1 Tax=Halopelagius fulvigenes TaxID=1198324 RepID=A0ABD5TVD4_9EURY